MKNIAIASLLSYTYGAAVLGPLPKGNTAFPKIATVPTFTAGSAGDYTEANLKNGSTYIGPYRGYRGGAVTYPTQYVKKWVTSNTVGLLAAQSTTRTFWALTAAEIGAYFSTSTSATNDANAAGYVICASNKLAKPEECNGAVTSSRASTQVYYAYKGRVYAKAGDSGGTAIEVGGLSGKVTAWYWNTDILLHTFFHAHNTATTAVTDGTKWCSNFETKLDSAEVEFLAANGFTGKTKCTW